MGGGLMKGAGGEGEGADLPQVGSRGEQRIPRGLGGVGQVASFGGKGRGGGGGGSGCQTIGRRGLRTQTMSAIERNPR
jgi:hypothetical protein